MRTIAALGTVALVVIQSTPPVSRPSTPPVPLSLTGEGGRPGEFPVVQANDNRSPAGTLRGDTLRLALEVIEARWYPEAADGPSVVVAAFAETGKAPSVPGPLIRVRTGTTLEVSVTNRLADSTLNVHGLVTRPSVLNGAPPYSPERLRRPFAASPDSLRVAPGETRRVVFAAGEPGTYFYWADPGQPDSTYEREQLSGAFIVDPAGGSPPDRVFVINIWGQPVRDASGTQIEYDNALAINGKSWPYTERLDHTVGDSVRWRVINASVRIHPMHLHGFYFEPRSHGSAFADTALGPDQRRPTVTDPVIPGGTMTMVWSPNRDGNWLFHCHILFHVVDRAALPGSNHDDHSGVNHMAGLVLGIRVRDPEGRVARAAPTRRLRLLARQAPGRDDSHPVTSFQLQPGARAPSRDSLRAIGPVLLLERGQPTAITVVNELPEPTGVHWHGIELESWSDGVAGWSGRSTTVAPAIAPGDSFVAHLTLRRAGTFIYHTHLNDIRQLTSGLYGALLVLEPGTEFDPATDHVFVLGWYGERLPPRFVLNGDSAPPPLTFAAGRTHRLRLINIGPGALPPLTLWRDTTLVRWRAWAKDGADLPALQAVEQPGRARLNVGETFDVLFTPKSGSYELRVGPPRAPFVVQRIVVP